MRSKVAQKILDATPPEVTKKVRDYADAMLVEGRSKCPTGCPCVYLDEPCEPNCTCVNPWSSYGCRYCCMYGSLEQKKAHAKELKEKFETKL